MKLHPRSFRYIFIIAVALTVLLSNNFFTTKLPETITLANGATLKWHECSFKTSFFQIAYCSNYYPAEYANKTQIVLPVVILRNRFLHNSSLPPLLYLNGGPGYATGLDSNWIHYWWDWKVGIGWRGDLVLFDQRGTGLSTPRLHCEHFLPMVEQLLPQHLEFDAEQALWHKLTLDCLAEIQKQGLSFGFLTTQHSAQDVIGIMQSVSRAMNYKQYTVYGVSYGTRLLLDVLRQSKNNTELFHSIILDSVYPLSVEAILDYPEQMQRTIDLIVTGCQRDKQCNSTWPNLSGTLLSLLTKLESKPVKLSVAHPTDTKKSIHVMVNDHRLLEILFNALYEWRFIEDLPAILNKAYEGEYDSLKPLVDAYVGMVLDDQFEDMTYLAVECADQSADIDRDDYRKEVERFPLVAKYTRSAWDYALCADWPVHATVQMKKSIQSEIPALILSGEYDPVTPVKWAGMVKQKFTHGFWYVFPGVGHGVLASDECATEVTLAFIKNPQEPVKPECMDYLYDVSFNLGD